MKITKHYLLALAMYCLCSTTFAQKIQWADHVLFQHNQYSETEFSANELLGFPNSFPLGKMNKNAFRLSDESAYGIATVGFKSPTCISQIIIVENFQPNRISKIFLKDDQGKEHLIYEPRNEVFQIPSRILTVNIEKTAYKVAAVSLHINTFANPGWAQIDAIGVSENIYSQTQLASLINEEPGYDVEESIRFAGEKEKLSPNINSRYSEAKPVLSPDGKTLYFARKFSSTNIGGKNDQQDIYYSQLINGHWTVAQNIGAPLNDELPNGVFSVSPDGNALYLLNSYYNEEGIVLDGISVSRRTEDGKWAVPEKMEIDNFYNHNEFQDYAMSASGNILLLAIEREDGYGDQDLHVSFKKEDGTWSEPKNMGRSINTELVEYAPQLSVDEKTLFFASNGHTPDSRGDIYYAKRLDETWANWTKPQNIGFEVNTNGLDAYFTVGPRNKYAYFVSSSGGEDTEDAAEGGLDIYRIPLNIEPQPKKVLALTGKIFKKENNEPVFAKIAISSTSKPSYNGFAVSNFKTGDYNLKMPNEGMYEVVAEAEGYLTFKDTIDLSEIGDGEGIVLNIPMEQLSKGHKFALNNLFFIQSKAEMQSQSEPELERLFTLLQQNPDVKIELSGHTDNEGYRPSNVKLSLERAEAVKNYLITKGIDRRRIKTVGFGPDLPVAPNDSEENKAKNRRVEVEITSVK